MEKRNKILKKGKILIVICLVVTLLFMDVKNSIHADIKNSNDVVINDNNNQENGEILDEELTDEEEYIPYLEELPKFKDEFERALFVYGWFYDIGDLFPYLDQNNEIDEEWYLLKATELTSIEDMKEYAYKVFDKEFIDKKFTEVLDEEYPLFKETKEGILVRSGYVSQYGPYLGYDGNYQKIINKDGSITYKVTINDSISSGPNFDMICNTTHEYKMTKNSEGKLVFTNFEYPTNICLKDIDKKYN